ncbi:caspase recruitment domain-containing protein 8-like isoform X2 [Oncorhynchus masou masou]|uniref:caspase recruitment domain-containing protein 8-like isoform X2 n=1 Tax=Oncorhynchus masou masou TaxID=90313 RepID=UPI003183B651
MDISTHPPQQASFLPPTSKVAASEREQMSAGTERDKLPSTSSGRLTPSGEKRRGLETVISRLEMLNVGKKTLDISALLLTGLEELTEEQLKTFQSNLTTIQTLGFPPIPESQLENTDRQVTVDQMVKRYGPERAVRNTLRILREMDLDDLSKKIERERFPEDYNQEDSGTYRLECPSAGLFQCPSAGLFQCPSAGLFQCPSAGLFQCPSAGLFQCPSAGLFQCSITGLVFRMEGEGEVLYRTVHWDMRLLSQSGKRPAGPLFMFTCLKGSVSQLHLPHCEICPGGGCDFLSVAHVTDDIIEFIPPHKITETHVIINITGFCAYGLTKEKDAPVFPIKAQVLLFYRPSDDPELEPVLHVLLLPRNVVRMKVQEERARRNGMRETFIETTSDCELTPDQIYSLSTDGYHKVTPKNKKFDNDKDYENYTTTFAVFLPAKVKKAELTLKKKKNIAWSILDLLSSLFVNHEYPWKGFYRYQAPLPAATPAKPPIFPGQDFIPKHRIALETRLGLLQPILLHLEDHKVLNAEEREEVLSKSTKTLQNQALLDMVVRKGDEAQEKFYQVLREADHFLVRDLEKKKA